MPVDENFSWADRDELVIKPVDAVAIYTNVNGDLVIRQQNHMEDDAIVVIPKEHGLKVIEAIKRELQEN